MRLDRMELLGVSVRDFDAAVAKYTDLFGLDFLIFVPGRDYALTEADLHDAAATIPVGGRIAMDRTGCFEIVEMPDAEEGMRNIHFRVDDMDEAVAHFTARGMTVVRDLWAGTVREVVFDASDLGGIRVCLAQYEGESLAGALADSPAV